MAAQNSPQVSVKDTTEILIRMWDPRVKDDLYKWVMYSFRWGEKGTELEHLKGPRAWQKEELDRITAHILENKRRLQRGEDPVTLRVAVASGRGIGKSALVSWLTLWHLSCNPGSTTVIAANSQDQLSSITFNEIGKWLSLFILGHAFERTSVNLEPKPWFVTAINKAKGVQGEDKQKYYARGKLWNDDTTEGFLGEHNPIGMMVIFDEASGIPGHIWDAAAGFFTERSVYRFHFAFSNPRRNHGNFADCFFSEDRKLWRTVQIDARTIAENDQSENQHKIDKYGIDSDIVKVDVLGQFPSRGSNQFISSEAISAAQTRELERYDDHAALVMGVDPARYGDDDTVIRFRRGRDARSIPPIIMNGADNMKVANKVAELIDEFEPDAVFIDSGAGAGIIDRLRERDYKIHEVGFGTASNDEQYADHRTELWGKLREWLNGAMIDSHPDLAKDLVAPEYSFFGAGEKIRLESKEKMKKRGLASPDHADALAVTFHASIARKDSNLSRSGNRPKRMARGLDRKIFG